MVGATAAEARVLEVRAARRWSRSCARHGSADGRPFERSHDLFRADRVRIVTRVRTRDPRHPGSAVEVVGARRTNTGARHRYSRRA